MQERGTYRFSNFSASEGTCCHPEPTCQISSKMPRTLVPGPGCEAYGNVAVVTLVWPVNLVTESGSSYSNNTDYHGYHGLEIFS
jgi:hypothetical protein